jgi:hypothetical protein
LNYFLNVLAAFSHVFNAVTGGTPRNSFSARVGKAVKDGEGWAIGVSNLIDHILGEDHCLEQAVEEGLVGGALYRPSPPHST